MKTKSVFTCQQCGQEYSKWVGRCQECGSWNSVVEERASGKKKATGVLPTVGTEHAQRISDITSEPINRIRTDLSEFDTLLGGGLVPGSVVLLGGEPGVGKSTLLLQAAEQYSKLGLRVLYVTGEESSSQVAMRSHRLKVNTESVWVLTETCLERVLEEFVRVSPQLLMIDSIQTLFSEELDSQPGSVGQLRECAFQVIQAAKATGVPTFLVGHVTKEGAIAGPKVLEHMVDVVLYFEGTTASNFRLLRSIKNRYGSTNEIGVFEMVETGIREVRNPSEFFLAERPKHSPGSVIVATIEGTRPLLVEVQALVSRSSLAIPRRTAIGIDPNRVSLLVAILEKRAGFQLFDQDVYVNVAGGIRLTEPACDLGVLAALISSHTGTAMDYHTVFFGEVGLGGEVRSVPRAGQRLGESHRIGLKRAFIPSKALEEKSDLELVKIEHVQDLVGYF